MLRDVQNQYGSNLPTPFFLDFEKPHGFLAYALLSALFACTPPDVAIKVVKECLEKDTTLSERTNLSVSQIVELVDICLKTKYFSYQEKFYKHQHGCVMGSPVSPVVVSLCIETFE